MSTTYPAIIATAAFPLADKLRAIGIIQRIDAPEHPGHINATELWRCEHGHRLTRLARDCAERELRRRIRSGAIRVRRSAAPLHSPP